MYDSYDIYNNLYDSIYNTPLDYSDYGLTSNSTTLGDTLNSITSGTTSPSHALNALSGSSSLSDAVSAVIGAILITYLFIVAIALICAILKYIGQWKAFKKAGVDGWEALIPVHNLIVEFKLAGIKTYWYFLLFIPIANIIVLCWKDIELAKAYGKSAGFGIGLFLLAPIFYLILGLGKSEYVGPQSNSGNSSGTSAGTPVANTNTTTTEYTSNTSATNTQPVQESLFNSNSNSDNGQGTNNN